MLSLLVAPESETLKKLQAACKRTSVTLAKCPGQTTLREVRYRDGVNVMGEPTSIPYYVTPAYDRWTLDGLPLVAGHAFLCRIEHTPAGNLCAGPEPVEGWREAKPTCDHCRKQRNRKDTFVLRAPDGSTVRVGRQCLKDYLRTDPTELVRVAELCALLGDESDDDRGLGGGRALGPDPVRFLAFAQSSIEHDGFRKSEQVPSTKDLVWGLMSEPSGDAYRREQHAKRQPTDKHFERAQAIVDWLVTERENTSDYIHNLCIAASLHEVTRRTAGLLASAPCAYDREMARRAPKPTRPESKHVGAVKDRLKGLACTIEFVKYCKVEDSVTGYDWGGSTLYKFVTDAGEVLTWFCSGKDPVRTTGARVEVGDRVLVTGTVKKHETYKGVAQTVLSRCKVEHQPKE